jgi:hypothetical protein
MKIFCRYPGYCILLRSENVSGTVDTGVFSKKETAHSRYYVTEPFLEKCLVGIVSITFAVAGG